MAGISTPALGNVTISGADGAIQDGVSSSIKATVLDYTNSNPLAVRLTDTSGDYVSAGAGTQYTEGDTDTTITGTATMMEVASNVLQPIQGTVADGLLVNLGTNNDVTVTGDALTSLQLIDDVVRAEDTAHTTADKGVFILGVRNSSNSALTTADGDYSPINVDDTGSPQVVIKSGSSKVTGNISSEDADSGEPVKVGGKYNLTPITLTDGDRGDIQLNAAGDVKVSLDSESVAVTNAGITTIAGAVAGTEMQVDVLTMPTVTVDSELPAAAALGATDANPTAPAVGAFSMLFANSAGTWNRMRSIENGINSTGSGILNAGIIAQFDDTTPGAITENQFGPVRMSSRREVYSQIRDAAGNERGLNIGASGDASVTIVSALPAGTNAIGKLAANSGVDIGDVTLTANSGVDIGDVDILSIAAGDNNIGNVDIVTLPALAAGTNGIGKLIPPDYDVTSHTAKADKYYTNAGAVTDGIIWSPGAGKRWHVTLLYINVSAAASITIEDDLAGGDVVRWKGELAANSGVVLPYGELYPMTSTEDAADLIITTSAGNVYVQAIGYEI